MNSPRIFHLGSITDRFDQGLSAAHDILRLRNADALTSEQADAIEILVTSTSYGCSAELIDRLPNLRAICSFGVGYDSIDVEAAKARNIVISNTPDVLNDCVADLALGLMIACARSIPLADRFVRSGSWLKGKFPLARKVSGKRLGIVGLGRIGQDVAKRAAAFDMDIRYHTRRVVADCNYQHEPNLKELASWADFMVLTCPGGAATRNMINAEVLEALGPDGILINIARGSVVDEPALVEALVSGKLGGAGIDAFVDEPNVPEALFALDNVVLLAHMGSATEETRLAMEQLVMANLQSYLDSGELITPV